METGFFFVCVFGRVPCEREREMDGWAGLAEHRSNMSDPVVHRS